MSKYIWTEDMGEISGFGGNYEEACRAMLLFGVEWLDQNPQANPEFQGYQGVFGIARSNNKDAQELDKAIQAGADSIDPNGGMTGAMYQAVVERLLYIKKNGWKDFQEKMRNR